MARFPYREADIARLAQDVVAGFTTNTDVYPNPPVPPDEIADIVADYDAAREAAIVAAATSARSTAAKDKVLQRMIEVVKRSLRYAENTVGDDSGKLQLIGWGARRPRTRRAVPGQVRTLSIVKEGAGWVFLDWKEPVDGGQVATYKVERRRRDDGDWTTAGTAIATEIALHREATGVQLEYRVIAVNKAGEGAPSNVVQAVL